MNDALDGNGILRLAAGLVTALVLLPGCAVLDGKDKLDPRNSFTAGSEDFKLEFMDIPVSRKLDKAHLEADRSAYVVGPGDILQIDVVEEQGSTATTIVMPDGRLYYGSAPGLRVTGKTIPEVEEELEQALRDAYPDPVVNVVPVKAQSQSYSILGQVQEPGVFGLDRPTTVLEAVSMAGGIRSSSLGDRTFNLADLRRSVLLRDGKILPVNFEELIEKGKMDQNVYLKGGDYLVLPAKGTEKVYILGNANRPGGVPYSSDLSFVKAIASAGGPAPSSFRTGLLLVRGAATPEPRVARINLTEVLHGKGADFSLKPNDVIWIPRAPWKKLGDYSRIALDSALTTIAIQQAEDSFGNGGGGNGGSSASSVELGISSGSAVRN